MGGHGSGRQNRTKELIKSMKGQSFEPKAPIATEMFLPNVSNVQDFARKDRPASRFTVGSVLFVDSDGKITQDNANFFWDDTNNRLAIGTTSPDRLLHLESTTEDIQIKMVHRPSSAVGPHIEFESGNSTSATGLSSKSSIDFKGTADLIQGKVAYGLSSSDKTLDNMVFLVGTKEVMRLVNERVGIGTSSPSLLLNVNETDAVNAVQITTAGSNRGMICTSNQDDAGGVNLTLQHDTASAADADECGRLDYKLSTTQIQMIGIRADANNGEFQIRQRFGGALKRMVNLTPSGIVFNQDGEDYNFTIESDTDTNAFHLDGETGKIGIGAGTSAVCNLDVDGGFAANLVSKTANYTATTSDHTILCGSGNETFTVTLPAATGVSGIIYNIKNIGTGTITIDGASAETIDGATTQVISTQYDSITIQCDGSNWHII